MQHTLTFLFEYEILLAKKNEIGYAIINFINPCWP